MEDNQKLKVLHETLVKDHYELPDYNTFASDLSDPAKSKPFYDALVNDKYEMPDYETFVSDLGLKKKESLSEYGLPSKEVLSEMFGNIAKPEVSERPPDAYDEEKFATPDLSLKSPEFKGPELETLSGTVSKYLTGERITDREFKAETEKHISELDQKIAALPKDDTEYLPAMNFSGGLILPSRPVSEEKARLSKERDDLKMAVTTPDKLTYILGKAYNQSLVGLADGIVNGKQRASEDWLKKYDAGTLTDVTATTLGFMLDMPFFGVMGKVGAGIGKAAAKPIVDRVMANSIKKYVAAGIEENIAKQLALKAATKVSQSIAGMTSSGVALGSYGVVGSALGDWAQPGASFDDIKWGNALKRGAKDFALGTGVGGLGIASAAIASKASAIPNAAGRIGAKIGTAAGGLTAESALFTYGGAALEGRAPSDVTSKEFLETVALLGLLKVSNVAGKIPEAVAKPKETLTNLYKSLQYDPKKPGQGQFEVDIEPWEVDAMGGKDYQSIMDIAAKDDVVLANILKSDKVPALLKQKILWGARGTAIQDVNISADKITVNEEFVDIYNKEGVLVDKRKYASKQDAEQASLEMGLQLEDNKMQRRSAEPDVDRVKIISDLKSKGTDVDKLLIAVDKPVRERTPEESKMVADYYSMIPAEKAKEKNNEKVSIGERDIVTQSEKRILKIGSEDYFSMPILKGKDQVGKVIIENVPEGWRIKRIDVDRDKDNRGAGREAMQILNKEALKEGKTIISDIPGKNSDDMQKAWGKLVDAGEAVQLPDKSWSFNKPEKPIEPEPVKPIVKSEVKPEVKQSKGKKLTEKQKKEENDKVQAALDKASKKKREVKFSPESETGKIMSTTSNDFTDTVLKYFIGGGTLHRTEFKAESGWGEPDIKAKGSQYMWMLNDKTGVRFDVFHEKLANSFGMEGKGAKDMTNAIIEILREHPTKRKMMDAFKKRHAELDWQDAEVLSPGERAKRELQDDIVIDEQRGELDDFLKQAGDDKDLVDAIRSFETEMGSGVMDWKMLKDKMKTDPQFFVDNWLFNLNPEQITKLNEILSSHGEQIKFEERATQSSDIEGAGQGDIISPGTKGTKGTSGGTSKENAPDVKRAREIEKIVRDEGYTFEVDADLDSDMSTLNVYDSEKKSVAIEDLPKGIRALADEYTQLIHDNKVSTDNFQNEEPINKPNPPVSKGEENNVSGSTETTPKPVKTEGGVKPIRTNDPVKQKQIEAIHAEYDAKIADAQKELAGMTDEARRKVIAKAEAEVNRRNTVFGDADAIKDGVIKPEDQGFVVSNKPVEEAAKRFDERKVELTKQVDALNKERESKIGEILKQQTLGFEEPVKTEVPKTLFHSSKTGIETIPDGAVVNELGIHFGSKETADKLSKAKGGETREYEIDLKNPIKVDDFARWEAFTVSRRLLKDDVISQQEYDAVNKKTGNDKEKELIKILKDKGYDGFVYDNYFEGGGKSYVVFDKSQIKEISTKTTANTLNDAVSKYGWSAVKNPEGFWLQNKDGKPMVKVVVSGKKGTYKFMDMSGTKLMDGRGQFEKSAEKLLKERYYAKEVQEITSEIRPEAPKNDEGIKFKDKTYVSVDEVLDAIDKGEITFDESKQLREDVNKFEEGLRDEAAKKSNEIGNKIDKGASDIEDKIKKDIDNKNSKLSVKLFPDIISSANTALYKQLVKVRDKMANAIAGQLKKGVTSQTSGIRWSTKVLTNLYNGLLRTQADIHGLPGSTGKLEMTGTVKAYAPHKASDLLNEWRKVVNSDPEALRRVLDVLDPEIAIEPLKYGDLSTAEKNLYFTLKEWNTWMHTTNYKNGLISTESYLKFKGDLDATGYADYIARMYDTFEEGTILSPEIQEFISRGSNAVTSRLNTDYMKLREETNEWKKTHAIRDPAYLTAKRVMQTIQNVAVKQYMDLVIDQYPEYVKDYKKGEDIPKGFVKLGASYSWGPLRNKLVASHIVEDFTGFFYQNALANSAYDLIKLFDRNKINQFYKKYRTVYNPFVQTGNVTGNVFFASINGINPFSFVKGMVESRNLHTKDPALYDKLLKSGLIGDTGITGDMKPINPLNPKESALGKADEFATKAYVGADNLAKISAYQIFRRQGMSHEAAIRRAYDAFQNYSTVGKTWDVASKVPLVGPTFVKFQADLQRILLNSMLTTPLTTIGTFMMIKVIGNLASALSGETEEEQKIRETRKGVPYVPFLNIPLSFKVGKSEVNVARYLTPLFIYPQGDSEMDISELSKFMPFQVQKKEEGNMFPLPAFADATWGWVGSVLADRDFRLMSIQDPTSTRYTDSGITTEERIFNVLNFAARSQVPFYKGATDIYKGATGQLDYYGRKRSWEQAILNNIIKIQEFDKPELKNYVERNLGYLTSRYASLAQRMGNVQGNMFKAIKYAEDKGLEKDVIDKLYESEGKIRDKRLQKSLDAQIPITQEIDRLTSVYKKWYPQDPFIQENFQNIEAGKNQVFNVLDGVDLQKRYPDEYLLLKKNDLLKKPDVPKYYRGTALTDADRKTYSNIYWSEYIRLLDQQIGLTQEEMDEYKGRIARRETADTPEGIKNVTRLEDVSSMAASRAREIANRSFRSNK